MNVQLQPSPFDMRVCTWGAAPAPALTPRLTHQHRPVPVHEADDPGGLGAVNGGEVRLHEGELVGEEIRRRRVRVRLGAEDNKVCEALRKGVVQVVVAPRVGAGVERHGVEAGAVLGEVAGRQRQRVGAGAGAARLVVCWCRGAVRGQGSEWGVLGSQRSERGAVRNLRTARDWHDRDDRGITLDGVHKLRTHGARRVFEIICVVTD